MCSIYFLHMVIYVQYQYQSSFFLLKVLSIYIETSCPTSNLITPGCMFWVRELEWQGRMLYINYWPNLLMGKFKTATPLRNTFAGPPCQWSDDECHSNKHPFLYLFNPLFNPQAPIWSSETDLLAQPHAHGTYPPPSPVVSRGEPTPKGSAAQQRLQAATDCTAQSKPLRSNLRVKLVPLSDNNGMFFSSERGNTSSQMKPQLKLNNV